MNIFLRFSFSLEVRKIPVDMNTIDKLNGHFSQFGQVTNIQVCFDF